MYRKYVHIRNLMHVNMCTYVFSIYLCEPNSHERIYLLSRAIIFYIHVCMYVVVAAASFYNLII